MSVNSRLRHDLNCTCINMGQRLKSRDHPTSQILSLRSVLTPEPYSVQFNLSRVPLPVMTESSQGKSEEFLTYFTNKAAEFYSFHPL